MQYYVILDRVIANLAFILMSYVAALQRYICNTQPCSKEMRASCTGWQKYITGCYEKVQSSNMAPGKLFHKWFILSWFWNLVEIFTVAISILLIQSGHNIGIDHDTVCAGVGGTAIRHSTSCAGRRAAACGRDGRHNECCAWWQYHPRQRRPYKWSISILPRSQFYKKQGKLVFSTSCTAVRPHWRLRNDAWRRDS